MNMLTTRISKLLTTAAGAAIFGLVPSIASARPHFADIGIDVAVNPQPCAPVVVDHVNQVWVEPTYRTECDRVWVAPVTEDREVHTWVPDRFETQDVVYHEGHHRYVRQEEVLVEPAHDVCDRQQVVVTPGHYEDVQQRVLVTPGHYEDCVRRVVIAPRPEARIDVLGGWLHLR